MSLSFLFFLPESRKIYRQSDMSPDDRLFGEQILVIRPGDGQRQKNAIREGIDDLKAGFDDGIVEGAGNIFIGSSDILMGKGVK
jgi:hypothetical protein